MRRFLKVNTIFVSIIIFIFLANGCSRPSVQANSEAIIPNPDKIILYNLGKTKEVKKGDKEFEKIIKLTNDRIETKKLSTVKDIIDDEYMNKKKNVVTAIELVYDKEQELNVKGDGFNPITYNKLFFELSDPSSSAKPGGSGNIAFQYGDLNHYKDSSRGPIKEPKELTSIVEDIFK